MVKLAKSKRISAPAGRGSPSGERRRNRIGEKMLRQSKVSINFNEPVAGKDLQDGTEYLSTKLWVIAEVVEYDLALARFITFSGEIVGEWPCSKIIGLAIPQLSLDTPVVMAQKSHDYQREIKKQRPNAWSKWTPAEEQQLRAEYDRGLNLDEIADIHHRTPVAISERLFHIGIYSHEHPKLGIRTQNRYYQDIEPWKGRLPAENETITVCLGCGYVIQSRPCMCWTHSDTSDMVTWREHRYIYSMYGTKIGQRY
jgi:hypothetical protein